MMSTDLYGVEGMIALIGESIYHKVGFLAGRGGGGFYCCP